ncbi:MAG: Ig-like domain-containing protein [Ferruginibacter sp.]
MTSANAALVVNQVLAITTQPVTTQTLCSGNTASFSVVATGTGLTYQWKKGGSDIFGATSATLTLNNITVSDAGNYTVVVSGASPCTSLTSSTSALIVNQAVAITSQPAPAQTVCSSFPVSFSVSATGTGITYQWYKNGVALVDTAGLIAGVNSNNLTIPQAKVSQTGTYTVIVSGASPCGTVTSMDAQLTVNQSISITSQPSSQTICQASNVSFTVAATGTITSYVWRQNGIPVSGSNYSGENTPTLNITNATAANAGNFDVVISSPSGICSQIISSPPAILTVNALPAITVQPSSTTQTLCLNATATQLSVTATGAGITYQWYSNAANSTSGGTLLNGATSSTYTPVTSISGVLYYYVIVSGTCTPAVTSDVSGAVTVNALPAITAQPSITTQTLCLNVAATQLSITAAGAGLTYQWYSNATNSNTGGTLLTGATSSAYTPVTTSAGTLYYYAIVSGTCTPPVTSNVSGAVTINGLPAIITQPATATQTPCLNATATQLSVTATGAGITYQWYSNAANSNSGGTLLNGATSSTYTPVTSTSGVLYYYVIVSGTCTPAVTSDVSGAVTVNALPAITAQPSITTQTLCLNVAATQLSITATGAGLTYQWYSNATNSNSGGTLLAGATTSVYTPVTTSAGILYYYAIVSGTCTPPVTSNVSGAVTVNALPAITVQPSSTTQTLCLNTTATQLSVTATGAGITYQWYSNATNSNSGGTLLTGATSSSYTPITSTSGVLYYYVIVNGTCTPAVTSNVSGAVTVNALPAITAQPSITTQTVCLNVAATQLSITAAGAGLTYQWYSNASNSNTGGTLLTGATSSAYTPVTTSAGILYYYAIVSGTCTPPVTSNVSGAITVNAPPAITSQPAASTQTLCLNATATQLSVLATGAGATYQWYSNTVNSNSGGTLLNGATSSAYTPVTTSAGTLYYYVIISGTCTPPVTSSVSGAVTVNTPPAITVQPSTSAQNLCINSPATQLSVTATGIGAGYQWYSNAINSNSGGTLIGGATSSAYTPLTTTAGIKYYYVVVSGTCAPSVTSAVSGAITVSAASVGGVVSSNQIICEGNSPATLNLTGNIGGVVEWQSAKDPNFITTITQYNITTASLTGSTIGALSSTTYFRAVIQNNPCSSVFSSVVSIAVNLPFTPVITASPASTICLGQTVTFTAAGLNSLATITNGDFSNANPLGWSGANANNNNGDPNSDWGETGGKTYSGVPYNSGSPSGPKFQIVNGTTNSAGNISILSSPIFSTVGRASASVEWYQGYNLIGAAIARVEISIDGGSTYSTLVQYTSSSPAIPTNPFNTKVSIDLSAYLGQPNMKVRFYYIGTTGSNWAIDDVNIVGPFQPLTYTWPAGFTVSGNSASITPSPPGTYNYTLTTSYGGCAATTTNFSVTVNPLPTITGTLEVCAGSTTQLAGSVTPAASTPWVSASTSIATVSNTGLVTGVSAGTSIITYKNSNGCTITDVVTVNARPAITGTLTVCAGTTTALSGSGIPSASTPWASAQPGVATVSSTGVVTGVAAGTSVITYTNSNGCTFTATVSVSDPATITTQPVTANFCLGSNATITVAASGTSVTYQWQVSTAGNAGPWTNLTNVAPYSGVTTNTLTVATPAITLATNFYRVIVNGNATCAASANSNAIALMYRNVWMGTTSSDWNTTSNWSDNQLPSTACPNVYIPNRANQPTLNTAPAPPGITNLIIDPGAILTVANYSATSLKIAGTITNNGTFDVRNGSLEFNGTSPQSIAGSYFFTNTMKNLKVSNTNGTNGLLTVSAAANDTLKITGEIAFGNVSNTTITTGDNIVLISNAVGTARVADVTNNGANSGNSFNGKVTVERFFTPSRSWRLVTAPVNNTGNIFNSWQIGGNYVAGRGMFVTGLNPTGSAGNGLDYSVYNNFSMKTYNPVSNNYVDIANTITQNLSTNSLNAGNIGYFAFIRGDRSRNPDNTIFGNANVTTLSAKGNLQTGTQTFNVTGGPGAFVLLGNPYASSIDFSKVAATNVNTRRFYVYDPTLSTVGAFVVMEDLATPGTFAPTNISISPQGNHIQSSQAFFVEVTGSGPSLTISENAKSANYNTAFFRPATPSSQIQSLRVNVLYVNADNTTLLTDGTFVQFDGSFNDKVDIQDALKFGNITESLSLLRYNKYLAVERRPLVTDNDTIFLQLSRSTQRNYRFQFIPSSFDPAVTAFLEDSFTGKQIPLNMTVSSNHDFAVTGDPKSAVINRFRIVFKAVAPGPLPVTFKSIKAYKQASHVNVEWTVENERNISRYEVERSVDGVTFVKANTTAASVSAGNSKTYNWLDTNPVYGNNFYRIRSVNLDGSFEYTNVVVVKLDKPVSGIRIYPNPVTNGIIGAEFKNMAEGIYKVRLLNNLGQAIFSKTVNHAQGTSLENIESNYKLIAGIYQLEVTSPTKEITMIKVIVK